MGILLLDTKLEVNLLDQYISEIEVYKGSNYSKSQEVWFFIIIDTIKRFDISRKDYEEKGFEEYRYLYVSIYKKLIRMKDELVEGCQGDSFSRQEFLDQILLFLESIINIKRNSIPPKGTTIWKVRKRIPTNLQSVFYEFLGLLFLFPSSVLNKLNSDLSTYRSLPSLKEIVGLFNEEILKKDVEACDRLASYARENIIHSYINYVKWYAYRYKDMGIAYIDIIQAGNLGLMKAVEKFSILGGASFKTYARFWIRQSITRYIADFSRTIRLPVHQDSKVKKLEVKYHDFKQKYCKEPTVPELAGLLEDENAEEVRRLLRIRRDPLSWEDIAECEKHLVECQNNDGSSEKCNTSCNRRKKLEYYFGDELIFPPDTPICMDPTIVDDNGIYSISTRQLERIFKDKGTPDLFKYACLSYLKEIFPEVLQALPSREVRVIKMRHGFIKGKEYTLNEVGDKMGVTRERIRQIESQALRRLRQPRIQKLLRRMLDS